MSTTTGIRIVDMPDLGAVTDASSFVGELAGSGRFSAPAITRYLSGRWPVNVMDYGARADGVTNDDAAILAAYNAAAASQRGMYFPGSAAPYVVANPLAITGPMEIRGDGMGTTLKTTSATADVMSLAGFNVLIDGIRFDASPVRSAGNYINMPATVGMMRISRCYFNAHWAGVRTSSPGSSIIDVEDCTFYNCVSGGSGIIIGGGTEIRLRHILMNSGATPQPASGVLITNSGDVTLQDVNIIQHAACLLLTPGNGQEIDSVWASDSYFDTSSSYGLQISSSGTGKVQRCRFIGCWFSSHGVDGVQVAGPGISGLDFIDCHIYGNTSGGMYFLAGSDINLISNKIAGNGGAGVYFEAGVSDWTVEGNTIGPSGGFGGNIGSAIFINTGASDRFIIAGNRLNGNTAIAINNAATPTQNQVISKNIGWIDKATGTGQILAAATTAVITHGLAATPPIERILITMRSGWGTAVTAWVSAVSATTFTITAGSAPGVNIAFSWQATLAAA